MENKMVWFARFPHEDASNGMWIECGEDFFYLKDTLINEYLKYEEKPFSVRFEKHKKGWADQFPEV